MSIPNVLQVAAGLADSLLHSSYLNTLPDRVSMSLLFSLNNSLLHFQCKPEFCVTGHKQDLIYLPLTSVGDEYGCQCM